MVLLQLVQHVQRMDTQIVSAVLVSFTWEQVVLVCHGLLHAIQLLKWNLRVLPTRETGVVHQYQHVLAHTALHIVVDVHRAMVVSVAPVVLVSFTWEQVVLVCHGLLHAIQLLKWNLRVLPT